METNTLKSCFNSEFDIHSWKGILGSLFPNVEFYKTAIETVDKSLQKHSIAKSIKDFGNARLADNRLIRFYEVELEEKQKVANSRVGLRNLIHTEINPGDTDAILAVYHTAKEDLWRLTFISKSIYWDDDFNEQKEETHPRRYTYVLGPEETTKTAVSQFEKLNENGVTIKSLIETFNVEKLNKEFFKKYLEQYNKFWQYIAENDEYRSFLLDRSKKKIEDQEKPIRDFTKKLLGRIVFLYFLQKKGWMGCPKDSKKWENGEKQFLLKLFESFPDKDHFHSVCLTDLFFNTLNRKSEVFKYTGTKVPYLNGGLFEEDKPKQTKEIDFPSSYFRELFEFFGQFNFTIDENNPDDHEVGIDPEMLGHIFESLLEDNRSKGAFYTPKAIVQYMTQESLIQYLKTHLGDHQEIEAFIRFGEKGEEDAKDNFIRKHATEIEDLLDKVKVCDPAIGSGAFPMGILNEIFKAKLSLDWTLDRAEAKKNIIQNSIYGVDLESGAVDIARLRFWLSLVVDEEEPQPLPNLDFKIMQGNSLLESFEGVDLSEIHEGKSYDVQVINSQMDIFSGQEKKKVSQSLNFEKIEDLLNDYFSLDDPKTKSLTHRKIDKHVLDHIHFTLEDHKVKLQKRAKQLNKVIKEKSTSLSSGAQKVKFETESTDAKKLKSINEELGNITAKEIKLNQLYQSNERPFFLWHLFFKEVFDEGGFDIVIGNPPYVQLQKGAGTLAKLFENLDFETFTKSGDIYSLFYEMGVNMLTEKGVLCYITSNKWMRANYGQKTRQFFVDKTMPLILIDFGNLQVFNTATVDTNILLLKKKNKNEKAVHNTRGLRFKKVHDLKKSSIAHYVNEDGYKVSNLNYNAWVIREKDIYDIKTIVEKQGVRIDDESWNNNFFRGVLTGYNTAFIIKEKAIYQQLIESNPKVKDVVKPILEGKDISKWFPDFNDRWLIATFPSKKIDINDYPEVKEYLLSFTKARLEQDGKGRKKTRNKWFETQDQISYWESFLQPKIIYPNMTKYLPFVYDESGIYTNQKCFIMTGKLLKYLTCFFNSKLFKYCFSDNFPELQGGTRELSKVYFQEIPVKQIEKEEELPYSRLVDYIITLKNQDSKEETDQFILPYFEQITEALIYELYFKEEFAKRELSVAKHLFELPELNSTENIMIQLRKIYVKLNSMNHPVKQALKAMLNIPQINLINNTVKI